MRVRVLAALVLVISSMATGSSYGAGSCTGTGSSGVDYISVGVACENDPFDNDGGTSKPVSDGGASKYTEFRWLTVCAQHPTVPAPDSDCQRAFA